MRDHRELEELSGETLSHMLHTFICEMENTLKDKNKRNRAYAPQVFWKNKYTLEIIETTLKNYEELTSKPVILYGRTHGYTQALIDTICKNYKEVKITNLEDEKKLKALEILKEILHIKIHIDEEENVAILYIDVVKDFKTKEFTHLILGYVQEKEKYDLLKEVLK